MVVRLQETGAAADNREFAHSNRANARDTLEQHEHHHQGGSMGTVALVGMTGGSGETTAGRSHLAIAEAQRGRQRRVLDTDPY